jgi:hypothetical protein
MPESRVITGLEQFSTFFFAAPECGNRKRGKKCGKCGNRGIPVFLCHYIINLKKW